MSPKGSQKDPKRPLKAQFNPKKQVVKRKPLCNVLLKVPRGPPRDPKCPQRLARGAIRDPKLPIQDPKKTLRDTSRRRSTPRNRW